MEFWIAAIAAALVAALWLIRPLLVRRAPAAPRAAHDLQVFRDQLRAVDRDLDRGVLGPAEAEGARAEISRRLLSAAAEADGAAPSPAAPRAASRTLGAALALLVVVGGGGLYLSIGAPGAADQPLAGRLEAVRAAEAERPSQAEAERAYAADAPPPAGETSDDPDAARMRDLIGQLRAALADRPDDVRGRRLLADSLLRMEDPSGAAAALREVVSLQGEAAPAADRAALAEAMILAAGGYVSPEAERELGLALEADRSQPVARYYAGLTMAQAGKFDLALRFWRALLAEGPPDAPWNAAIRAQIGDLARAAGEQLPEADAGTGGQAGAGTGGGSAALPGPDADALEAAREMTPEGRAAMIDSMVAGLEDRLATEGGAPEEWERLIRAYGVLGRTEDAVRIWTDAQRAFAEAPEAVLARLREAAVAAGAEEKPQ